MTSLPPFPDPKDFQRDYEWLDSNGTPAYSVFGPVNNERYERARAEAYKARLECCLDALRLSEKALRRCYDVTEWPGPGGDSFQEGVLRKLRETLKRIGELP